MSISDQSEHCIEDLYAKYLQFTSVMLEEYKDIEIAGVMVTQALSMYKTVLPEEDYQRMVKAYMKEETMSKPSTELKSQTPAEGILKRNNWGDAITYQVTCECQDANHDHNVWVEADDHRVTVTTYTTQKSQWWSLNRWQTIWRLLTKGYVEYEANIIMTEQQALNYAETLKKAVKDVSAFKQPKENSAAVKAASEQDCV